VRCSNTDALNEVPRVDERRKAPREELEELAHIFGDGSSIQCVVRNISEHGAAIELPDTLLARPQFQLMMGKGRTIRKCRVVWSSQNRLGIEFID
jgi:hypothetical protein